MAALLPIAIFWLMDAQYLRYERGYRRLFDRVRRGEDVDAYSLDASLFMHDIEHIIRLALSWSVAAFYVAILLSLGGVAMLVFQGAQSGN